jgi:chloramphenicol 3-O-phosphotransferase
MAAFPRARRNWHVPTAKQPTLVYLYGPPAAGKLTIAEKVRDLTGYRLFHNHLTVNAIRPVFEFGTLPFAQVIHRLRLDVFETAARNGIDLVFTNNSAWPGPGARERFVEFASKAQELVDAAGGRVVFAWISAPLEVLEERVSSQSRRDHQKLVDIGRLGEVFGNLDNRPLHEDDLRIDTSVMNPEEAAQFIFYSL